MLNLLQNTAELCTNSSSSTQYHGSISSGNYFARKTFEPPTDLLTNLRISQAAASSTSQKHKKFTSSQDLDNKPVWNLYPESERFLVTVRDFRIKATHRRFCLPQIHLIE